MLRCRDPVACTLGRSPWFEVGSRAMRRLTPLLAVFALAACPGAFYFDDGDAGSCPAASCPGGLTCSVGLGCVECTSNAACGALRCLVAQGRCVECLLDADCGAGRVCEQATHHCLEACSEDDECASDKCDRIGGIEVCLACRTADHCQSTPGTPRCDTRRGACVRCLADADCGGAASRCDRLTGTCRECTGNADCGAGACGRDGLCLR